MTPALLAGIAGLALLDSLNPATILAVTLVLLAAPRRAGLLAATTVLGAALTVFTVGALLFLSAGAAAGTVDGVLVALRFLAFGAAGLALVVAGLHRLRDRPRRGITLPAWFGPWTAVPFGVAVTAADLPNAFPYFVAIERMVTAEVSAGPGLAVVAAYAVVYCVPCLVLLGVGLIARERTRERLEGVMRRFGTGVVRCSVGLAVTYVALGIGVVSVPWWI